MWPNDVIWHEQLFMCSLECHRGVCCSIRELNTKVTLSSAHKKIDTRVHTTFSWWRHQMETFSALLTICAGNSPVPVNSPHKGQWGGALMFSLICVWINDWVYNRESGGLRRHRAHYDVIVMRPINSSALESIHHSIWKPSLINFRRKSKVFYSRYNSCWSQGQSHNYFSNLWRHIRTIMVTYGEWMAGKCFEIHWSVAESWTYGH